MIPSLIIAQNSKHTKLYTLILDYTVYSHKIVLKKTTWCINAEKFLLFYFVYEFLLVRNTICLTKMLLNSPFVAMKVAILYGKLYACLIAYINEARSIPVWFLWHKYAHTHTTTHTPSELAHRRHVVGQVFEWWRHIQYSL